MTRTLTAFLILFFTGAAILSAASLKLPAEVQNKKIIHDLNTTNSRSCKNRLVDDAASVTGKAWKLGTDVKHFAPMRFGLWQKETRKHLIQKFVKQPEIPTDEKYHVYYLGQTKLSKETRFWFHYSWLITLLEPGRIIPDAERDKVFDVYVSAKLTGPAYVPGSKSENAVYLERLIMAAE